MSNATLGHSGGRLGSLLASLNPAVLFSPVNRAARAFRAQRIDYYQTMADRMEDTGGRNTLLSMFQKDATRFAGTARGVLSAEWARRYEANGADLSKTWEGTIPNGDLMVIRVAQASGGQGLAGALRDVARVTGAVEAARGQFIATAAIGLVAMSLATAAMAMMPLFFAPITKSAFSFIPIEQWGSKGQGFMSAAEWIGDYGWLVAVMLAALVGWIAWSLPNFVQPRARTWLDKNIVIYQLYRDFRGALFLATISSMVRRRAGGGGMALQQAMTTMSEQAEPWLRWHCRRIVENIDQSGGLDPTIFDTGILDREIMFLLLDAVETQGFDVGLQKAGARTESRAGKMVEKRAGIIRWVLLIVALFLVGGVVGWYQATMFEMRDVAKNAVMYRR